ncbi:MAG: response regulator [Chloroflexi bacterium]|nr:response regulator [Chloroflexota bacterium]
MGDVAPESFTRQVRDCLAHLYDFTVLQTNPLAHQIAPNLSGLERVETVRRVLIETIERLKVRETVGIPSRQDRIYTLLSMRYIEGLSVQEVIQQFALGERQFYREHQRAIQTVSQLLWDRLEANQPHNDSISVKSEIQRLGNQSDDTLIDTATLLSGVLAATAKLAEHHQVTVHLDTVQALRVLSANQGVLRQTIIWMLSQIIALAEVESEIGLGTTSVDHNPVIYFDISGIGIDLSDLHAKLTTSPAMVEFLATLQGTITITKAKSTGCQLQIQLRRQRQVILVIDDNPEVVSLLERYVTGMPYDIFSAYDAGEGFRLAQSLKPTLIVLDIMLPHTDGWKMLQDLKLNPHTQSIPVLVCSVLENPDLALSLGADNYLRKPPNRVSFLEALGEWTASEH